MKLILFKSKTCGPCRMFEPQVVKAGEELGVEVIRVDVDENETFDLWKPVKTGELIGKYGIQSSGTLIFLLDETVEDSPTIRFERPCPGSSIVNSVRTLVENGK